MFLSNYCSKVDICLHKPLWPNAKQPGAGLQLTILCGQLDLLCKRELRQNQTGHVTNASASQLFRLKARQFYDRVAALYGRLPPPRPALSHWLESRRVHQLYPHAAAFLRDPERYEITHECSPMHACTQHIAALHQVHSLCQQLHGDALHLTNHKYVAHQLALLYQTVKSICSDVQSRALCAVRDNIARQFQGLKQALAVQEGQVPRLNQQYKQWILQITSELSTIVTSFSSELGHPLVEPAAVLGDVT